MTGSSGVSERRPQAGAAFAATRRAEPARRRPSGAPSSPATRTMPARTMSAASSPPTAARSTGRDKPSRLPRTSRPTRRACALLWAIWCSGRGMTRRPSVPFAQRANRPGLGRRPHQSGCCAKAAGAAGRSRAVLSRGARGSIGAPPGGAPIRPAAPPCSTPPSRRPSRAHRGFKLEHDLAQLGYLLERGRLPPSLGEERESLYRVLNDFGNEDRPNAPRPLTPAERQLIGAIYNRVI